MTNVKEFILKAREKGFTDEQIKAKLVDRGVLEKPKEVETDPALSVEDIEQRIEERLRAEYDQKLAEKILAVKEELKQENKTGIKNVLKHILMQ